MPKKGVKFQHNNNAEIGNKIYEYDNSCTIRDMLIDFLQKTNSKITLDPGQITFMFGGILNRNEEILNRTVGEIFKNRNNVTVKVIDTANIVGGNIC